MLNIYAFIVGIDGYPGRNRLNGCVRDAMSFKKYLDDSYLKNKKFNLQVKILCAEDDEKNKPTRDHIIQGFDFFDKATGNDVCLFYFAGHGATFEEAPPGFRDSSGSVQSFVCIDSLDPEGKDLMDKEMSYLIWKTTINKPGVTFVAITDCCHSGTITRAVVDIGVTERSVYGEARRVPQKVDEYLGYNVSILNKATNLKEKAFEKKVAGSEKYIDVKTGKHIHFSAATDSQTAKELVIDNETRGAFTHSLIKTLYSCGGQISYNELINQTAALVKNRVLEQEPAVMVYGGINDKEKEKLFLSQNAAATKLSYLVYNDTNFVDQVTKDTKKSWCINAGTVHGVTKGDKVIIDKGRFTTVVVEFSNPDISILKYTPAFGTPDKSYPATVQRQPNQDVKISFHPKISPAIKKLITKTLDSIPSPFVSLLTKGTGQYVILSTDTKEAYISLPVTKPGVTNAVFTPVKITDEGSAKLFVENLEKVGKWNHVLEFNNPVSDLTKKDYRISLYISTLPGNNKPETFKALKELKPLNDLPYLGGKNPAFRLLIYNTSDTALWVTNAYLGFDYSIQTGIFLSPVEIGSGKKTWLTINDSMVDIIPMEIEDRYRELGYDRISEYIKLFISSKAIDTGKLKQEGVNLVAAPKSGTRGVKKPATAPSKVEPSVDYGINNSWKTETIGFTIFNPKAK